MTKSKPKLAEPKDMALKVEMKPGETPDRTVASLAVRGLVTNATTAIQFLKADLDNLSLTEVALELRELGESVNRGDLAAAEQMLNAQALALNTIFTEMARRAALNMGTYVDATDRYMRLALKAQAQCRATVEALAEMKNPRAVAFVRQANIANGAQQVNNGATGNGRSGNGTNTRSPARTQARETEIERNELLERQHGEWLDPGAQGAAIGAHQGVAAVGPLDRTSND